MYVNILVVNVSSLLFVDDDHLYVLLGLQTVKSVTAFSRQCHVECDLCLYICQCCELLVFVQALIASCSNDTLLTDDHIRVVSLFDNEEASLSRCCISAKCRIVWFWFSVQKPAIYFTCIR